MVAQLLTWPIYEYSIWTNILHQIFPSGFKGKNKTYGLVALMVAQLLTWPIYEYSIWTNILHQIFPSGFKGKKSSQVQQTNSTPDLSKL